MNSYPPATIARPVRIIRLILHIHEPSFPWSASPVRSCRNSSLTKRLSRSRNTFAAQANRRRCPPTTASPRPPILFRPRTLPSDGAHCSVSNKSSGIWSKLMAASLLPKLGDEKVGNAMSVGDGCADDAAHLSAGSSGLQSKDVPCE